MIQVVAPVGDVTPYDQRHLALYAALIDAEAAGMCWREIALRVMLIDPDQEGAERCCRSHLERGKWITGEGLGQALLVFGVPEIHDSWNC